MNKVVLKNYDQLLNKLNSGQLTNSRSREIHNIKILPETIRNLVNLTDLDVQHNLLTSIPETTGNLVNLTVLDISFNQLNRIPESIGNLVNLTLLYINDNQLNKIPDIIGNLVNLSEIWLEYNPLNTIPRRILYPMLECSDAKAVVNYFKVILEKNLKKKRLLAFKCTLVGTCITVIGTNILMFNNLHNIPLELREKIYFHLKDRELINEKVAKLLNIKSI